jgi:hypothetical protein
MRKAVSSLPGAPAAGTAVRITYTSGQQCDGAIDRFARGVALVPHFGTVQCWDDPECGPPPSEAEKARSLWEEGAPASPLAHVLPAADARCEGAAAFARPASLPALRTAQVVAVADREAMGARMRALPAFRKQSPACATQEDGCSFDWTAFRFPDSDVVWTSGVLRPKSCGGDEASLWALWRGRPGEKAALARVSRGPTPGAVVLMLDVNADGEPEFLVRNWVGTEWRIEDPKSGETLATWGPEYHDCPC